MVAGEGDLHDQTARHRAGATQGQNDADDLHLAQRHGLRSHREVFICTWGYGRYAFHLETGKLERLVMKDGKEHGDPIYAYTLAWPPEFLTPNLQETDFPVISIP